MKIINFLKIRSFFFENISTKQTILKNTFWLTLAEFVSKGISFFVIILLARHFGPADYGQLAFSLSFVALFAFFVDFGFTTVIVKEISRDKSKASKYIENMLSMKIVLGLATYVLIVLSAYFLKGDSEILRLIYFLAIATILDSFVLFFQSIFSAHEKMEYVTISRFVQGISLLFVSSLVVYYNAPIVAFGYAVIVSSVFSTIITLFLLRSFFVKFFLKINFSIWKEIFIEAWPVGIIGFVAVAFQSLDAILLGFLRSNSEVGLYSAAVKIPIGSYFILTIFSASFLPSISRAFKEKSENLKKIVKKYALVNFSIGIPMGIGGFILAPQLIGFLYGYEYELSVLPLQILSLSLIPIFMTVLYGQTLIFFDKQRRFLKSYLIGLGINIFLNFLLIPIFGIIGAAFTALITQLSILLINFFEFRKIIKININNIFISCLLSSLLMAAFLILMKSLFILNPIFLIILSSVFYFSVLYFLLNLTEKYNN